MARISAHRDPRRHAPTRDHVIPSLHLGRKPLDHHWNLRPACSSCNGSKNHYVPHWAFLRWDLLQAAPPTSAMLEKIRSASKRASFWWPKPLPPPLAIFIEGGSPPYPSALLQHLPSHSSSAPTMAAH